MTNDYLVDSGVNIGEGSFAHVRKLGKYVEKTSKLLKGYKSHEWLDEVFLLKILQSPYVPVLYDYCILHHDRVCIRMGYAGIDLKVFYKNITCDADRERYLRDHFIQICKGLQYMHSMHIVHCDIKPKNVLLHNGLIKLIDFNLSQFENGIKNEFSVFAWPYRPLEIINKQRLSCKSDLYALGCMLFYFRFNCGPLFMYNKNDPPSNELHMGLLQDFKVLIANNHFMDPVLNSAVKHCLEFDIKERYDTSDVLSLFSEDSKKRKCKYIEACNSKPFGDSYSELVDLFALFEIPPKTYEILFLTCWYTWSTVNYDKDCLGVMVFLIIKMLCRGDYPLIQRIEILVPIDVEWLQENVYLNDYEFLLTSYKHYLVLQNSSRRIEHAFHKLEFDSGIDILALLDKEM
eukprot:NODE_272_length_12196_cov_0.228404.p4 type:complete len:403 gc:universal NODE_272_length_12196_cov_0.228404:297-1505(+)